VGLHDIPNDKRKTEDELVAEFEACKAEILGGFLDTLAKAMGLYSTIKLKGLFRMADFTKWGCAIAVALGKTSDDFIKAYESKVKGQIEEAAYQSPVATVLIDFLESAKDHKWEGSPTELFKILRSHADDIGISTRQKIWPKAPNALVRKLNELASSLKSLGYEIDTSKSGPTRRIGINTVPTVPNPPVPPHPKQPPAQQELPTTAPSSFSRSGNRGNPGKNNAEDNKGLTIQEILESVRAHLGSVFPEEKLLAEIMQLGFSWAEALKRMNHFKQKEDIVKDDVGNWHFNTR
jgi:hypothetical protein